MPASDHGSGAGSVAAAAAAQLPLFLVDGGWREDSGRRLPAGAIVLPAQDRRRGALLRNCFATAAAHGYSHAIVLDADGRQDPADVPRLCAAARAEPDALIAGIRDLHPGNSSRLWRVDRRIMGFWLRLASGRPMPDASHGFRCYPLLLLQDLDLRGQHRDFEQELLVAWSVLGRRIRWLPVAAHRPRARASRLRVLRDYVLLGWLFTRCIAARMTLPPPLLRQRCQPDWRRQPFSRRCRTVLATWFAAPFQSSWPRAMAALLLGAGATALPWPPAGLRPPLAMALAALLRLPRMLAFAAAAAAAFLPWHPIRS